MRILDISDGLSASAAPTAGPILASGIATAPDDATYVATYGAAVLDSFYFNTTSGVIRVYDGAAWQSMITAAGVVQLTNKDIDGGTASNSRRITIPGDTYTNLLLLTRKAGTILYATDQKQYYCDTGTGLQSIGGGGGGSSLVWRLLSNAPSEADVGNLEVLDFDYLSSQELWAHVRVPDNYTPGFQILLVGGAFATVATSGNVKFLATAYLVRAGSTVLGTYSNSRQSTNGNVAANGVGSTITAIGNVDLTDASGQINGVAVAAGDLLLVKLIRDTANESSSAAADARFLRNSMVPKFS